MTFNKYLVLGGDLRNLYLYKQLNNSSNKVKLFGFENIDKNLFPNIINTKNINDALENVEIIIGPIPCCIGSNELNSPFLNDKIYFEEIFDKMKSGQIFIAGRINKKIIDMGIARGIKIIDILEQEQMAILNAIPTAEGAIQLAMENLKTTLHSSNILVTGYGRIGKVLTSMLKGFGANIFVTFRNQQDYANIKTLNYTPLSYENLNNFLPTMDLIINTVPNMIFDKSNLKYINHDCFFIDLASKPFGIDFEESKKEGLNVIWAPSLPGKVAPITAATYIIETVNNIIKELV